MAALEIEQFKREKIQRSGAGEAGEFSDAELLREVMNTIGKKDRLGEQVRCVVSVSMLTEGWDANTVTPHSRHPGFRHPSFSANRSSGVDCAAIPMS